LRSDPREYALYLAQAADEARALEIVILQVGDLIPICEYFVICHSRSSLHNEAICERVEARMREQGHPLHHREGNQRNEWIIVDYLDVVLHVFSEQARKFYNLERLWAEAPRVELKSVSSRPLADSSGGAG